MIMISNTVGSSWNNANDKYPEFLQSVADHFRNVTVKSQRLFTTDSEGLYEAYLDNLLPEARQHYTCHTCEKFILNFGGLVILTENGELKSALWDDETAPEFFKASAKAMKDIVLKSQVTGVFLSEINNLGVPKAGGFDHFSVLLPYGMKHVSKSIDDNASQVMALKLEEYKMLVTALAEFNPNVVNQAVTLLNAEALYRSEKCLGVAQWMQKLQNNLACTKNTRIQENIIWYAVAKAPIGYAHVRSSMIGTLLEELASGLSIDIVKRRFDAKMDPTKYQRQQTAPSAGNIAQAEKIVEAMGLRNSFKRRYARREELQTQWSIPVKKAAEETPGGMFSHLIPKDPNDNNINKINLPSTTITWDKFSKTIMPNAEKIECLITRYPQPFSALVTAVDLEAPPILQWDSKEQRCPFSWYVYNNGGSYPVQWGLTDGVFVNVTDLVLQPSMWYEGNEHQGKSLFILLEGAKDKNHKHIGIALFPEILKSELRQIRSTIEAFSKTAEMEGYEEASACGLKLEYGARWNVNLRVTTKDSICIYTLDRWD